MSRIAAEALAEAEAYFEAAAADRLGRLREAMRHLGAEANVTPADKRREAELLRQLDTLLAAAADCELHGQLAAGGTEQIAMLVPRLMRAIGEPHAITYRVVLRELAGWARRLIDPLRAAD